MNNDETHGKDDECSMQEKQEEWNEIDPRLSSDDAEEIADAWLDTAIECKKAGRIADCIEAHKQRMKVFPYYKTTDAIRLLGMGEDDLISAQGLFELHNERTNGRFVPSKNAQELGNQVKPIFLDRGYKLQACLSFLLPYIDDGDSETNERRIFSSQSFLQHRHEVFHARREIFDCTAQSSLEPLGELEILVWIFLFGLAIRHKEAVEILGSADVDALIQARLLRKSPIDPDTMLVAEVQIYPIDIGGFLHENCDDLKETRKGTETCSLFLTDWNLESLRPTHSAIMPVGYDTLELIAVTAGEMVRQRRQLLLERTENDKASPLEQGSASEKRILDLCCGCGIQGIFAWLCYKACVAPLVQDETCELVLTDINERALYFVTANLAINGIASASDRKMPENRFHGNDYAFGLCGDLFGSLKSQEQPFDLILCNPPFVAIPSTTNVTLHQKTPLYGVGGGLDGMVCLRQILQKLYHYLSIQNPQALALMVTEVPNVQESPSMLISFLPESYREEARVRIAYVEADVETMEDYAKERQVEAGIGAKASSDDDHTEWLSSVMSSGIYNRALVLISFARGVSEKTNEERFGLFNFQGLLENNQVSGESDLHQADPVDEEDMFLHQTGMEFARKALLFCK